MAHPAYPGAEAAVNKVLPKDEYKVIAWMAGMGIFGFMASSGESAPPASEEQTPEQLAEIEAFFEAFADPAEKNDLQVCVHLCCPVGNHRGLHAEMFALSQLGRSYTP